MNNKRHTLGGGGRFSLAPQIGVKTPTRPKFGASNQTPAGIRTSTARFSVGGVASANKRLSIFKMPSTATIPKDTNDKPTQARMVRKIYNYIQEKDGDEGAIAEVKIASPQTKDFVAMFEQIYEGVVENYEYPKEKKLTEEIPRIFAELGYPYVIKTSTLQTIGASHCWHYLLHALCWLIDFVKKTETITVGTEILLSGDDSNAQIKSFRMSWAAKGFHSYQKNRNLLDYNEFIENSIKEVKDFFENNENINGQIKNTEMALEQINFEIEELKSQNGLEDKYREDIRKTDDDLKKINTYLAELEASVNITGVNRDAAEAVTKEMKAAVDMLQEQVSLKKQEVIEQEQTRGIKGDQAKVYMSEYNQLKHQLRECQNELESLSKQQWTNQPKAAETFSQLLSQARKIIGVVRNIGDSVNYTFENFDETTITNTRALQKALLEDLRHEFEAITSSIANATRDVEKEMKGIEGNIAHLQNCAQMESEKLADLQQRNVKKSLKNQHFTEEARTERKKEQLTIDKLENEKETLLMRKKGVNGLQNELENMQREFEETLRDSENSKEDLDNKLRGSAQTAFSAINAIRTERNNMERTMLAVLRDVRNIRFGGENIL